MSYMSPSYLIQSQFDTSWTPLAKRYSLLLYREVGWEDDEVSFVFVLASSNEQPSSLAGSQSSSSPEMLALLTRSVQ
jgi:hypothetical protein